MQYEIKGGSMPVVVCTLQNGESIKTEKGAMSWMSPNMEMQTNAGGGIGKAFSRIFTGESMFQNIYTARGGTGLIAFASSFPGEILAIPISASRSIVAQKHAFLTMESGVDMKLFFQKRFGSGLFGGEGFIMQQFLGNGIVFLEIDGSVVEYELQAGQSMLLDNGYLAAMDATVQLEIEKVSRIGNVLFGGEGLFNTKVTGPGHIWLQSMPINQMASVLRPYFVSENNK